MTTPVTQPLASDPGKSSAQPARSSIADYVQEDDKMLTFVEEVMVDIARRESSVEEVPLTNSMVRHKREAALTDLKKKRDAWRALADLYRAGVEDGKEEMPDLLKLHLALKGSVVLPGRNGGNGK